VPISRVAIVLGRSLAGGIRASTQYVIVLIAAIIIGAKINLNPLGLFIGWLTIIYVAMGFTGLSILIASTLKTRERFMGIIGAISMPLFFASNALYPVDIMPEFIKIIALGNPLTYTVNILRKILIHGDYDILVDLFALTVFNAISIMAAFKCFSKIIIE
jgi:ABC-2 type transport system permease protein